MRQRGTKELTLPERSGEEKKKTKETTGSKPPKWKKGDEAPALDFYGTERVSD